MSILTWAPGGPLGGPLIFFGKNDQKPLKSLKIATLVVRDHSRSTGNEKLTLDNPSKYDFDRKIRFYNDFVF